jgi:hypothetical protein
MTFLSEEIRARLCAISRHKRSDSMTHGPATKNRLFFDDADVKGNAFGKDI